MRGISGRTSGSFLVLVMAGLWAQSTVAGTQQWDRVCIGVRPWFSQGADQWTVSFRGVDPDFGLVNGKSEVKWKHVDGTLPVVFATVSLVSWCSIEGAYGSGSISGSGNTDTDWIDIPSAGFNSEVSQSSADTDGHTYYYNVNVLFRLNPEEYFPNTRGRLDLVAGYQHYEDKLRDKNGVQTVVFDAPVNEPFIGLDSTFDFKWDAARLGLREEYPLLKQLWLQADATGLLLLSYKGEGFWNLRDDLLPTSPNFTQKGGDGYGADLRAGLEFRPFQYVSIEAGYWWFWLQARDAKETTFFADNTSSEEDVDKVESTRQGFYAGVRANF